MINNDYELDISPELDLCSSSLNSTQENTPLLGPLRQPAAAAAAASTDFTLESASLMLETFQLSFLESLDDQLQHAAQDGLSPSFTGHSSMSSSSANSISNFHLSYRSPSSFLFDPLPIPTAPNDAAIPSSPTPISTANTARTPAVLAGGASSSSANNNHADFFDTDVIMDRSGEEVNFLRGPQLFHSMAGAAGAPDTSNFNANYPNYYLSQDPFAIANTYQSETEADHSDHHSAGSASANGTRTARRRRNASCQTHKKKAAAVAAGYTAAPLMHNTTATANSPFTSSAHEVVKNARTRKPVSHSGGNDSSSIFDKNNSFTSDNFFTLLSKNGTGGSSSSNGRIITAANSGTNNGKNDASFSDDSLGNGYSPPFSTMQKDFKQQPEEEEGESSFSLFPPIIYKQFDPRYAIPLLPDSAPSGTATAPAFE